VRPAVDGDRSDVAGAVKSARPQHAIEVVADQPLEVAEGHRQQFVLPDAELGACVETLVWRTRDMGHMDHDRLRRITWMPVAAEIDREVERNLVVKTHRSGDRADLEIGKGAP